MASEFSHLLFNEIVAEGLEGITFESLLRHLQAHENNEDMCNNKELLWKLILDFENINFYKLNSPRECNYTLQNRCDHFDMLKDRFTEEAEALEQQFVMVLNADEKILGSCESYAQRLLIDDEIKNMYSSFAKTDKKFGNTLIMVANDIARHKFLGLKDVAFYVGQKEYAFLELIGRYRHNGVLAIGKYSALTFFKSSKDQWYTTKQLKLKDLIRVQKINIVNAAGKYLVMKLLHINRCYRPFYSLFEQNIQKLYSSFGNIPCQAVHSTVFYQGFGFDKVLMNRAIQCKWIEKIKTTYRKLNENCHLPLVLSDNELLTKYLSECNPTKNGAHTLTLLDETMVFIKKIKSDNELRAYLRELALLFEEENGLETMEDDQPLVRINFEDPREVQILNQLAIKPMSECEIQRSFMLGKTSRRTINSMLKEKEIRVEFKSVEKNSVAYYSIQPRIQNNNTENLSVDIKLEEYRCGQKGSIMTPMESNPRRRERYAFLIDMVKSKIVIPGCIVARNAIAKWEISRNLIGTMDKKSFHRILDDAVTNKEVAKLDAVFNFSGKTITDTWLVVPGTTEDSQEFKEHYDLAVATEKKKTKYVTVKKKKKKKRIAVVDSITNVDVLALVKNVDFDNEPVNDVKLPDLPKMIRRKILHEFIWYICYGSSLEPDLCIDLKCDDKGYRIYVDQPNWKRYVAPMIYEADENYCCFTFNDILLRMPLCFFCLFCVPTNCNKELFEYLSDDNLKWQTIGNIVKSNPKLVSFLLNSRRNLCQRKFILLLESILNMGLITRINVVTKFKMDGRFYLNKEVFITDTSKHKLPLADAEIWMKMPRFQWILRSKVDLLNYWENVYNVCTSTKSKSFYGEHSFPILTNGSFEICRNSDFISKTIKENGPLLPENVENIRQFGAMLPLESIRWQDIGPGGFCRSVRSTHILNWCQSHFDESCKQLPESLNIGFAPFRATLFTDIERDKTTAKHISSLNENLSGILNEINIVLIAATVLNYDKNMEFFWRKIRNGKWFKRAFSHIAIMNLNAINSYRKILTTDHVNERECLIELLSGNNLVQTYLKKKKVLKSTTDNWIRELAFIRMILNQLVKIHRFIPQWDTVPNNGHGIEQLIGQITESNIKLREKTDESRPIKSIFEAHKRDIAADNVETMDNIISLTLRKYMTGCMKPYLEPKKTDIKMRNTVLKMYPIQMILSAINSFKCFYSMEPLKAKHLNIELLLGTTLDSRLRKFAPRFAVHTTYASHNDKTTSKYMTWCEPPPNNGNGVLHQFGFHSPNMKDMMVAFSSLIAMAAENNPNNYINVDITKEKLKYIKDGKTMSTADWIKLTKDITMTISITEATYQSLYKTTCQADVWDDLTQLISLPKSETDKPTCKKMKMNSVTTEQENIFMYIEDGEFGGRNHSELKKMFSDRVMLNNCLDEMIKEGEVYLIGLNTFQFVSKKFIKPWLIKIPSLNEETDKSVNSNRKRTRSMSDSINKSYFIPEFYLDEIGQFKAVTFKEIIDKLYVTACKFSGITLAELIAEPSVFLGPNVVRQLVNVLVKYKVVELHQLRASGKCGLFSKRVTYSVVEMDPYDSGRSTTVNVCPLSHIKMYNMMCDMGEYFGINIKDCATVSDSEPMDESLSV